MKRDGLESLVLRTKRFFSKNGKANAVVGVSGGVDSALVCFILAEALGGKNVFAFHLPYFKDGKAEGNAVRVASLCGTNFKKIPIRKTVDAAVGALECWKDEVRKGNVMARVRMLALYDFARKHDALVAGTGNKTELKLGYFTKYGDGAADVLPIGRLYKTQVRSLALQAGIPAEIVFQTPTAGLWKGQTDEGELGMGYAELDGILDAAEKRGWGKASGEFGFKKTRVVLNRTRAFSHKRRLPAVL